MPSTTTNGSLWLDTDATSTTIFEQCWRKAVATAGTTISGVDDYSLTLAYTVGFEQVYLNGVLLVRAVDYTATDGTSVVLTTATTVGDYVEIITTATFSAANTYTQAAANAAFYPVTTTQIAGKNKVINGDFGIWQRGTSFSNPANGAYTADRFVIGHDGTGATRTISQQTFTPGTAPVAGYEGQYFYRYAVSVAGTSNTYNQITQKIEDVRTLSGNTVTVSFWAKADAARTVTPYMQQYFNGSADVYTNFSAQSVTTSWTRFTATVALPSVSGKTIGAGSWVSIGFSLPAGVVQTIDIWGVQLEAGSVATAFTTASGGSPQAELAMCQRYYYRTSSAAMATGSCHTTTSARVFLYYPVEMRIRPTALETTGTAADYSVGLAGIGSFVCSAVPTFSTTSTRFGSINAVVASGLTQFNPAVLEQSVSTGYLGWSAEL
jgi:hypothetical protein